MKLKIMLKSILFTAIGLLLVALWIMAWWRLGDRERVEGGDIAKDDQIIDYEGVCPEVVGCFYKNHSRDFCFSCAKSDKIILSWSDGSQTKMIDDLKSGKVTIESLMDHGLKVIEVEATPDND